MFYLSISSVKRGLGVVLVVSHRWFKGPAQFSDEKIKEPKPKLLRNLNNFNSCQDSEVSQNLIPSTCNPSDGSH